MKKIRSQWGQGLIETLITVLVVAGGVAALLLFQQHLTYHDLLIQEQNDALILANSKIESLRSFSTLTGASSYDSIASGSSNSSSATTTYTLSWTITDNTDYKTINVTVTWTDKRGILQTRSLSTYVAKIDPALSALVNS